MAAPGAAALVALVVGATLVAAAPQPAVAQQRGAGLLGKAFRAYRTGEYRQAFAMRKALDRARILNRDYADFAIGQSALLVGQPGEARRRFARLARQRGSRFASVARWRLADSEWALGNARAARTQYARLVAAARGKRWPEGDLGVARFRIAESYAREGATERAVAAFRALWMERPAHPMADDARRRARELGGDAAVALTVEDRVERARVLTEDKRWRRAVLELDRIEGPLGKDLSDRVRLQRGRTQFKMRRQYEMVGRILLELWPRVGKDADWALFHGARALSRAHKDTEAIGWYLEVVKRFPRSELAGEAQYLAGWLHFNLGNYRESLPHLERLLQRYPRNKWVGPARWYLGFANYLVGNYEAALPYFERIGKDRDRLEGGKGRYWTARSYEALGREADAVAIYRDLVGRWPFSWYALLSRARLTDKKIDIGIFGDAPRDPTKVPTLNSRPPASAGRDPLIRKVDELIAAGLGVAAAEELRRGETGLFRRLGRGDGLAAALDRYRRAGNYNRPWMLAVVRGRQALATEPTGAARTWWEHAYPLAYRDLVERWRHEGDNPEFYLYSIMRKESGFDPHTLSHANALGLLQMIPPTTRRVAPQIGLEYSDDLLYDPESNIRLGSWYIGRLFAKFKGQVPIAAASYNAGPGAVMRWLRQHGDHPIDEYVELVSYRQARGYGKKVTETYARYLYLYKGEVYEQPLAVDANYIRNEITY